ncbi:hypothetical protein JTB14_030654 [Gonioctena quinquepunctata]|nr:hypothetical protein JTB14_030654 [Gonioctena quinquepunctata]
MSIARLEGEAAVQKDVIVDRDTEIEIANDDARRYQNDIAFLEEEIRKLKQGDLHKLGEEVEEKNAKISDLSKERAHMLELLNEKEKIINQMAEDSHQLHVNLVTIKSKLKEPGNIIDLGNKLKEEHKRSAELVREIHDLKVRLMRYKNNDVTNSVDEITDQLKRELDYSVQIDTNIMSAVSDQSLNSISETQDAEVYKKFLSFEKASKKQLQAKFDNLQMEVAALRGLLERERSVLHQTQADDAKLIGQLTTQLDVVLDREEDLKKVLDENKIKCDVLEQENETLKRKQVNSSESTEYKQFPTKEMLELSQLRKDIEKIQEEKEALSTEVDSLKHSKLEIETGFKYTKNFLSLEVQKSKSLEEKISRLLDSEKQLKEKLREKELEVERLQNELEQEKSNFNKQKLELVRRLQARTPNEVQSNVLTSTVPESMLEKIKELNNALLDNRKLMNIIQKLTNEKRLMENELETLKGDVNTNLPFGDLVARCDFLFAKTLKLESTKKALVWQKRYLTEHLQGHHQQCLKQALPNSYSHRNEFRLNYTLKQRFRSAVFVIVSIIRMKYLVRRWHSGVRIAEKVNARHYKSRAEERTEHVAATRFQVGQPVSSQLFANLPTGGMSGASVANHFDYFRQDSAESLDNVENDGGAASGNAWSGNTPPCKERKSRICIGSNVLKKEDLTPLKAPHLLAQFVERFDQIQEKLGVVLEAEAPQGSC